MLTLITLKSILNTSLLCEAWLLYEEILGREMKRKRYERAEKMGDVRGKKRRRKDDRGFFMISMR